MTRKTIAKFACINSRKTSMSMPQSYASFYSFFLTIKSSIVYRLFSPADLTRLTCCLHLFHSLEIHPARYLVKSRKKNKKRILT